MKLVKEQLYERIGFTEESDPIRDLAIGIPAWEYLKKDAIIKCIKFTQFSAFSAHRHTGETMYSKERQGWMGNLFREGEYYRLLKDAEKREDGKIIIYAINVKHGNGYERLILTPRQLDNRFKIIKKGVNEKFSEESDPIRDMGIGSWVAKIQKLFEEHLDNIDIKVEGDTNKYPIIYVFVPYNKETKKKVENFFNWKINYMMGTIAENILQPIRKDLWSDKYYKSRSIFKNKNKFHIKDRGMIVRIETTKFTSDDPEAEF